ncbi:hypothetical protein Vi05172_g1069 [Venturia inaequalis]|uniref:Uncharacterized protein n=1 Tax=Venturia inaequalis TaxID=5025 RepID=A0A8H3VVH0_VENIN|nr:hypothetical protein EG327_003912 [Venturia inaequalis]RDI88924.1 hypothetical protein Vi05172_g1069 [Venturia inaequalis]
MPPVPTKIVIIGTGLIGPRHAQAVLREPMAELSCIVDPNPAAQKVAQDLGTAWYNSTKEMLASGCRPVAAIVCTPNHTHVSVSKELLDAGIHVLVEKPISGDAESAQSLIQYAKDKKLVLLVGHHRRFNPYIVATKKFLQAGNIGSITAISGLWTICKPSPYFEAPMEWHRSSSSGGPIMINLIHEIDILHYLLGPITRVFAEKTMSRRCFEAEEGAAIVLRFESGIVGTFLLSDNTPSPHNFEAGTGENPMIPKVGKDVYRIFGTEGMVSIPDMKWSRYDGVNSWAEEIKEIEVEVDMGKAPFELQVKHLVEVLAGREDPVCSGADGLRAVVVCEAVKKALDTGMPVEIQA